MSLVDLNSTRESLKMTTTTIQTSVEHFELSNWTPAGPSRSQTDRSETPIVPTNNITSGETVIQELKPVDGGVAAWTVLITAFVFEAVLWGSHHLSSFQLPKSSPPNRIPHLLRRVPRILLHDPGIQRQFF